MANYLEGATRDLAESNTPNDQFNWLMVTTTAGSVIIDQDGGNTTTLASVPVGVWIPTGKATNVQTGSTAVGLMVA